MRLPRRHLAGIILLFAAVLLAVALTACAGAAGEDGIATANGGTGTPSASPRSAAALTDAQKARKFAECMRDHGIDVTASQNGEGGSSIRINGGNKAKVDAAMKACQQYAPGSGGSRRPPDPNALARARRFAQCMRDHGVTDFPDPDPNGGIKVEGHPGSDLAPDNPTFQRAQKACESLMGGKGKLSTGQDSSGGSGGTS
jgi:hypothetical protein